jgi:hypothetical protein
MSMADSVPFNLVDVDDFQLVEAPACTQAQLTHATESVDTDTYRH